MLTFLVRGTHVGCYATEGLRWGGACQRSLCVAHMLDAMQLKGWGGVGHVNVPCVRCTHVGCHATEGLGWGGAC